MKLILILIVAAVMAQEPLYLAYTDLDLKAVMMVAV